MLGHGKKLLALTLILAIAATALFVGRWTNAGAEAESYEGLKIFTEVLSVVKRNYVETADTKTLIYSAIRGMLSSLDPHSGFLTQEDYKEMQVDTKGEFGGLGIQIAIKNGVLMVISPIEDTPAWEAGIQAGDRIIKINGEQTKDMGLNDAVRKMRGPKGTPVTISVFREGWKELKDFTIVRDIIKIKSVKSKVLEGNIAYVRVMQFQEGTAEELAGALKKISAENTTSIILDLRNNPGGLLQSAIDVTGQFIPPGKLVVYLKGRVGDRVDYKTGGTRPVYSDPMVVLVNQGSASASEIVAGALKDWNRAVILGMQTFGKGSVQSVIPLSDGAGLRLTTARYYTPKGTSIQTTGITPDIAVKIEPKNGQKEHVIMREKDLERHLVNEKTGEPDDKEEAEKAVMSEVEGKDDTQLQRAIDLLKTWHVFKELSNK
ncbi:MAG: S41 family peptidase [Thermodesulfovibrionales bacterium]|nr:S41 family peptidase [Thermodesulfovibrionales bacterium]